MQALNVAVTGGIGAGKSTVSAGLAARGALVIDSDRLAREVVEPGTPGLAAVVAAFGEAVLTADGALDRPALGAIVFGDVEALRRLEGITHPLVRALFAERLAQAPAEAVVVNDIPLLRTAVEAARYHLVVAVGIADGEVRVQRLVRRGHTEDDARRRIAAQIGDDERRALADVWLDNSGDEAALGEQLDRLGDRLRIFAANRRAGHDAGTPDSGLPADTGPLPTRVSVALGGAEVIGVGDVEGPAQILMARAVPLDPPSGTAALAGIGFPSVRGDSSSPSSRFYGNADPGRPVSLIAEFTL